MNNNTLEVEEEQMEEEDLCRKPSLSELKQDINNCAYPNVPGEMSITEFEQFTCSILELFEHLWVKYEAKRKEENSLKEKPE